jgi:hypothetical protein
MPTQLVGVQRPTLQPTEIQQAILDLAQLLARARGFDPKGRGAFAAIASMMLVQSFAGELAIGEAEDVTRRAAA